MSGYKIILRRDNMVVLYDAAGNRIDGNAVSRAGIAEMIRAARKLGTCKRDEKTPLMRRYSCGDSTIFVHLYSYGEWKLPLKGKNKIPRRKPVPIAAAMGREEGGYIQLNNPWARVCIMNERTATGTMQYVVNGDLADTNLRVKVFPCPKEALRYAVESLAAFQEGVTQE
jgi:hypothetical protein